MAAKLSTMAAKERSLKITKQKVGAINEPNKRKTTPKQAGMAIKALAVFAERVWKTAACQ